MKRLSAVMLCLVMLFSLAACSGNNNEDEKTEKADEKVVIRLGYLPEAESFEGKVAQQFKEYVEEESGGSIEVNLFPGGQLGGETEMTEQVKMGTTEMLMVGELTAIDALPEYATALRVPYLFDSIEHVERFLNEPMSDTGKTIPEMVKEKIGIRTLGYYSRGARQLTAGKEVKGLDDLKGMKLRVPSVAVTVDAWTLTGAVPTSVEAGELYMSLSQGLVEAQENPVDFIAGSSLNEVQKYLMMTNHQYGMRWLMINEAFFTSLSEEQQKILTEGGKQYTENGNKLVAETEKEVIQKLEDGGMTVIPSEDIDIDSIKDAILSHIDELGKDWDPASLEAVEATR